MIKRHFKDIYISKIVELLILHRTRQQDYILTKKKKMGAVASRIWGWPSFTSSRIIETKSGSVQGKTFIFEDGKEVEAYLGIPYGKPPVGELRFKKPEPADPWNDVMDCTQWGPRCPHEDMWIERLSMFVPKSEDCLRLNVFTPTWKHGLDQKNGFAVMVWIHGGGFAVHSAAHYGDYGICK
uniref:Carboxylesterase type B domain-containing protein n=1 Tax=Acrobeloides nanus TaxID=290746 RepID=A0A914EI26_9BILA